LLGNIAVVIEAGIMAELGIFILLFSHRGSADPEIVMTQSREGFMFKVTAEYLTTRLYFGVQICVNIPYIHLILG